MDEHNCRTVKMWVTKACLMSCLCALCSEFFYRLHACVCEEERRRVCMCVWARMCVCMCTHVHFTPITNFSFVQR